MLLKNVINKIMLIVWYKCIVDYVLSLWFFLCDVNINC